MKKTKTKIAPKTARKNAAAPWGYRKGTKIPKKRPGRKTKAELARRKKGKKRR